MLILSCVLSLVFQEGWYFICRIGMFHRTAWSPRRIRWIQRTPSRQAYQFPRRTSSFDQAKRTVVPSSRRNDFQISIFFLRLNRDSSDTIWWQPSLWLILAVNCSWKVNPIFCDVWEVHMLCCASHPWKSKANVFKPNQCINAAMTDVLLIHISHQRFDYLEKI